MGTQRSLLAASGVAVSDMDSSAMSILGDTAQWGERDAQQILHRGAVKAWASENQAAGLQADAAMYGRGAKQAGAAGAVGAGTNLLSGAGQVADTWYRYQK